MKGIDKLPHLTSGQKEDLLHSAEQYKRFARVEFEVLEVAGQNITVRVAGTYQQRNLRKGLPKCLRACQRVHS